MCLVERQNNKDGETKRDFPSSCAYPNSQVRPETRNFILVTRMGCRGPTTWDIFPCLPMFIAESWMESRGGGSQAL